MCPISPKGEARTHGPHAPLVPKVKLGHLNPICHRVLILRKLSTWVGFNYPPRIGLKDTEPRAPSVPKVKLGHLNRVRHRVILPLVMAILGFLTIPWLGPKDTELGVALVPKAKLGNMDCMHHPS